LDDSATPSKKLSFKFSRDFFTGCKGRKAYGHDPPPFTLTHFTGEATYGSKGRVMNLPKIARLLK